MTEMQSQGKDFGRLIWVPDATEGFVLSSLTDFTTNAITATRLDNNETVTAGFDDVHAAEEDLTKTVDDNCALMYLNEGTLLNNCRLRYKQKKIYSYVANILISINPYENIDGLYSTETIKNYRGKSLGQLPPHIYAIADKAYRDMLRLKESQSIIVSGESGAGKTESQKAVLKYLCDNWGSQTDSIQQKIIDTNPILEAFGNAKTMRNNNSSRFGKFLEIHFGNSGQVAGGFVSHYLLEKSRICKQSEGERSYHIFFQLIAGLDDVTYKNLRLAPPENFNYLKHGNTSFFGEPGKIAADRLSTNKTLRDPIVDDRRDFQRLKKALEDIGLASEEIESIWKTVSSVLHLGNIAFVENVDDNRGGCTIDPQCDVILEIAAKQLGIEAAELKMGLVTRIMQATKGGVKGTLIRVPLKPHEAAAGRDALAKAIYSRLFDWLVARINRSINDSNDGTISGSQNYIGVLDIAGFEFFAVNSFEQFCINYCNEKLQHFFNERILNQEQDLYEKEGLKVERIEYSDNQDCIELFERKGTGLLDLLDEEARLPRASPNHYTQAVQQKNKGHFRLETPRKSRLRTHRDMREDDGFLVRHYAGTVCYHTQQFLEKNNDQLHNSLEILIEQSSIAFLRSLFEPAALPAASSPSARGAPRTKLQSTSVGSKFRSQLNKLIEKLKITGTHFVRCVKPNGTMTSGDFDGQAILGQLKCAGMTSVLKLMQKGFPSRTSFNDLYTMYQQILPPELARLHPRLFCKCLFRALGLNENDFKFGLTKVFFRPGKLAEFDQMLRQDPENMKQLVVKVRSWLNKTRWRKAQYGAWSVIKLKNKIAYRKELITRIQAAVRGYIVRKNFKPRLSLFRSALNLQARSKEMTEIISGLQSTSAQKWSEPVQHTAQEIEILVNGIKGSGEQFQIEEAVKSYEECVKSVDKIIMQLKEQLQQDEQAQLHELERKRREEEERQQKMKLEHERVEQEKIMRKKMEEEREKAEKQWRLEQQKQQEQENKLAEEAEKRKAQQEQEHLDASLAGRIAKEDKRQTMIDTTPTTSISSGGSSTTAKPKSKHDLSTWKYAELRDTINTSNDMDLLLACKEEFHRRLRIYNDWKARNSAQNPSAIPPTNRMPLSMMNVCNAAPRTTVPHVNPALTQQRYFKVPFHSLTEMYKPNNVMSMSGGQNGVWYSHFNGQYVCRQIVLHPSSPPSLLVAGKDDLLMCDRPLDQTDLPRRKGAEILPHEFETIWVHLGGKPLPRWTP